MGTGFDYLNLHTPLLQFRRYAQPRWSAPDDRNVHLGSLHHTNNHNNTASRPRSIWSTPHGFARIAHRRRQSPSSRRFFFPTQH